MTHRVIPNYALYGDQAQPGWRSSFDFEWIPTRSRPYNWKIRPHKHDAFIQILYLTHGSGEVLMDHAKAWVPSPCILIIPAQTVHGFHFSEDVNGPVVTAAQRPLESLANVAMPELLLFLRQPAILPLDKVIHHDQTFMPLFSAIEREAHISGAGQTSAGMALITALCIQLARLKPPVAPATAQVGARKTAQIEKFRTLVNADFKKHHPLTAYADQLGISLGQLSRLCREVLGVSSIDVINARLIHEAQRDLVYTTGSIKQVADSLGFADETYFGRFFRKHTGTSPREFRAKALMDLTKTL